MTTYTCEGKGGRYEVIALSKGAGLSKGENIVVYKCKNTEKIYHRTLTDFNNRMIEIDEE